MVRAPRLSYNLLDADSNTKDHKSAEGIRPSMSRVNVQFIEEPVIFVGTKCRIFVKKKD